MREEVQGLTGLGDGEVVVGDVLDVSWVVLDSVL